MKNRIGFYIAAIALLLAVALLLWPRTKRVVTPSRAETGTTSAPQSLTSPSGPPSPLGRPASAYPRLVSKGIPEKNEPVTIAKYLGLLMTPISFYGKAIDDKGDPVPGAHIAYQVANQIDPNADNSKYSGTSDKDGNFSIAGLHGASLYVDVSKEGYYKTPSFDGHRGSYDGFTYAGVRAKDSVTPPTSDTPAIFVLRKEGGGVALAHWGRSISIAKNGELQLVNLRTGRSTPQGDLEVQCWTEDQNKDARGHYPWQCQVSVVGGGLVKREGEFDFEAPAEGYQSTDDIAPPRDRWSPQGKRQYFVKTADGHYARITLDIVAGGDHFMTIESYYNPTPGDRNLEYNPNQQRAAQ